MLSRFVNYYFILPKPNRWCRLYPNPILSLLFPNWQWFFVVWWNDKLTKRLSTMTSCTFKTKFERANQPLKLPIINFDSVGKSQGVNKDIQIIFCTHFSIHAHNFSYIRLSQTGLQTVIRYGVGKYPRYWCEAKDFVHLWENARRNFVKTKSFRPRKTLWNTVNFC